MKYIEFTSDLLKSDRVTDISEFDPIKKPEHYNQDDGIQCIEAIKAAVKGLVGIEAVYVANVIKYVWRFKGKNGLQDLEKAKVYLEWLIDENK
jgi:hypothetical protein